MAALGGQNRRMGDAMLNPNELVLTFGGYVWWVVTSVPLLRVRTDRETDGRTDGHTQRQRQTEFIICPMLYGIDMGQVINWK